MKLKRARNRAALLHQTPFCRTALLFIARARDSKVSLLAGYLNVLAVSHIRRNADVFPAITGAAS